MAVLTFSNILSLLRAPLAVAFLAENTTVRLTILALAALTDFLDGYIARRSGTATPLGAMLDPIMDKVFVFFVVGILFMESHLTAWEGLSLISRDFAAGLFAIYLMGTGGWRTYAPRAFLWGKIVTVAQYVVFTLIVLAVPISAYVYLAFLALAIVYLIELLVRYHRN